MKNGFTVEVIRHELWGNLRDGFDCNNSFRLATVELESDSDEQFDKRLRRIAVEYFAGNVLARTENHSLPISARRLEINWIDSHGPKTWYEVFYLGVCLGSLEVIANG